MNRSLTHGVPSNHQTADQILARLAYDNYLLCIRERSTAVYLGGQMVPDEGSLYGSSFRQR